MLAAFWEAIPITHMKNKNTLLSLLALTFAAIFGLTGCSTVDGVGKDVEGLGEEIQDASD